MKAVNIKRDWAFTGNPIYITDDTDCRERCAGRVFISFHGNDDAWYVGAAMWPLYINIAEIVEAYTPYFPEATCSDNTALEYLEDVSELTSLREVTISATTPDGGKLPSISFFAARGGISRQNLRNFMRNDTDVFDNRLLRTDGNFFLTTRSDGWRIVVKESELMPLYFIPGHDFEISVRSVTSGAVLTLSSVERFGVYALNPIGVRRLFFETFDEIPSLLDILVDGQSSCRIVIAESMAARESYRLKFRNSFGVFDVMELQGSLSASYTEADNDSDSTYNRYDPAVDDFNRDRPRVALPVIYKLTTGNFTTERIRFLREILVSEEVYLLDAGSAPVRVIPECGDISLAYRSTSPAELSLTLHPDEDECHIMPDVEGDSSYKWRRLFTDEFTNEFD